MQHASRGIALKLTATFAFSVQYVALKLAGNAVPVGEVVFFRAFFALFPLLALSFYTVGPAALVRTERPWLHIGRSALGSSSMFLGFAALKLLPLADITAFGFVQPIFAVILAGLLLREKVGPWRGLAVVVAFGGVLMMVEPHGGLNLFGGGLSTGAGLALTAALCSAFVVIFIRQMSATEKSETIVFYFMSFCAVLGALTMIWWHAALTWQQAVWLILGGFCGGIGQITMTFSYRYAEPSLLAPFDYTAMIWAVLFGFLVFAEVPAMMVIAGAAVVTAAGVFIAVREHRIGRELSSRVEAV